MLNSPTRLKQEVLPNCGVACCELDFTRGLRMVARLRARARARARVRVRVRVRVKVRVSRLRMIT